MARLGRQWSDDERRRRKARRWLHSWLRAAWWVSLAAAAFLIYQAATPTVWWVEMTQPVGWLLLAGSVVLLAITSGAIVRPWLRLLPFRSSMKVNRPTAPLAGSREPIPAGLRFAVLRRNGFRCAYCGRGEEEGAKLHIDHIVPAARGGKTEIDNLVTACATCNIGKSASDLVGAP